MTARLYGEVMVTLLVIMDPPGNVPIFLAVTRRLTPRERNRAALIAIGTAFLVITSFALAGKLVLSYLNVSVPALQGAGGLLLLAVAMQLLTGQSDEQADAADPDERTSIAMVPLGTPLLAGPGAIAATIVFVSRSDGAVDRVVIQLAIVSVLFVSWLALRFSGVVLRLIKPTGVLLLSRVAGLLLAAIAVQMAADSVIGFVDAA